MEYEADLSGVMEVCRDEAGMNRGRDRNRLLGADDVPAKELTPASLVEMEPALEPIQDELAGGFFYAADEVGDAYKFSCGLQRQAQRRGATFRFGTTVQGMRVRQGGVRGVRLNNGERSQRSRWLWRQAVIRRNCCPPGLRVPVCRQGLLSDRADAGRMVPCGTRF